MFYFYQLIRIRSLQNSPMKAIKKNVPKSGKSPKRGREDQPQNKKNQILRLSQMKMTEIWS